MDENGVFVYCFWWILGLNLGREQLNGCMMYILLIVDYWYFMDLYGNWAARYMINRCRCSMTQMPHFPNPDVWEINAYIHECSILNMANNVWYTSFSSPWAPESLSQGLRKKTRLRLFFVRWEMKEVPLDLQHIVIFLSFRYENRCRVTFPDLCLACVWLAIHQTCQTCISKGSVQQVPSATPHSMVPAICGSPTSTMVRMGLFILIISWVPVISSSYP